MVVDVSLVFRSFEEDSAWQRLYNHLYQMSADFRSIAASQMTTIGMGVLMNKPVEIENWITLASYYPSNKNTLTPNSKLLISIEEGLYREFKRNIAQPTQTQHYNAMLKTACLLGYYKTVDRASSEVANAIEQPVCRPQRNTDNTSSSVCSGDDIQEEGRRPLAPITRIKKEKTPASKLVRSKLKGLGHS